MESLLIAKNISKKYGNKVALNNFSIEIPKASIYGLLGPNGAGKTTFIRIINQITMPDTGEIILDGKKLAPNHISAIGYMPEERGLYKNMKVGEQAIYLAQLKGLSRNDAKQKLKYWFDKLDIGSWWNKKLSELSKGMGQKIQFIVTVLHNPKLLIFDEPFSGFDPVNANIIRDEILELKEKGTTIIFSTHRMESVEEMCDYVALINKSNKVLDGEIQSVRNSFKKGNFKIGLQITSPDAWQNFKAQHKIIDLIENEAYASFTTRKEQSDNTLLQELCTLGIVGEYSEIIPSMNEVFINAVNQSL
ncbi:ABC transporter ATP-binding protein [Ornithobacterium rhinotracheale]|uniref:ABC transporter ATP-binding protein n=1 Tax=Ornithobacterium rhinotracheale TaxID=28251 RepID=A0A410JQE1_ORNRH|nr:ATP-binding cassette domain-containing protein [Ornithobacterium rhinotracheale]QAR30380.1 ABC transporter ATP-binding protein [Ornithobacterium rhinotracheale]